MCDCAIVQYLLTARIARRWEDLTLESDPGGLQAGTDNTPREKRLLECLLDCLNADGPMQCHAIRLLHWMSSNLSECMLLNGETLPESETAGDCVLLGKAELFLDQGIGIMLSIAMHGTDKDEHVEVMGEATQLLVNLSMPDRTHSLF